MIGFWQERLAGRHGEGIPALRVLEALGVGRDEGVGRLEMEGEAVVGYLRVERAALEAVLPIVVVGVGLGGGHVRWVVEVRERCLLSEICEFRVDG